MIFFITHHYRFLQLLGVVPSDANVLQRLGEMYDHEGDKSQAFQYHYDVSTVLSLLYPYKLLLTEKSSFVNAFTERKEGD